MFDELQKRVANRLLASAEGFDEGVRDARILIRNANDVVQRFRWILTLLTASPMPPEFPNAPPPKRE